MKVLRSRTAICKYELLERVNHIVTTLQNNHNSVLRKAESCDFCVRHILIIYSASGVERFAEKKGARGRDEGMESEI